MNETVQGAIFIGAAIIAITQMIKYIAPKVNGAVTIFVAVCVGIIVAAIDTNIGVSNLTIAQGIMTALAAVGVHTTVTNRSTPQE
jgi:hypothetical protein